MRRSPFLVLALLLAAFACNGDYDAAADAPAPADAGADTASGSIDGGAEGGPAKTGFCANKTDPAVWWCEDFDSLTDLTSLVPESNDESLLPKLARKTFVSEPQSVNFLVASGKTNVFTVIQRGLKTEKTMRLEVDWQWPTSPPSDGQTLQSLTIKRGPAQASYGRACGVGDGGPPPCTTYVATCDGANCTSHTVAVTGLDAWSRVALQASFGASGHVRFEQNGTPLLDADAPTGTPADEPTTATIGIAVLQGASADIELFFDNLVVELR